MLGERLPLNWDESSCEEEGSVSGGLLTTRTRVDAQGACLDSGRHAGRAPASTGSTLTGEQDGVGQRVEGAGGALGAPVRQIDRPVNEQAPLALPPSSLSFARSSLFAPSLARSLAPNHPPTLGPLTQCLTRLRLSLRFFSFSLL